MKPLTEAELVEHMRDPAFRAGYLAEALRCALDSMDRSVVHALGGRDYLAREVVRSRADDIRKMLALVAKAEGK